MLSVVLQLRPPCTEHHLLSYWRHMTDLTMPVPGRACEALSSGSTGGSRWMPSLCVNASNCELCEVRPCHVALLPHARSSSPANFFFS